MSDPGSADAEPTADELSTRTRRLVIVRRHQYAAFSALARAFADEPDVKLVWDRRVADRRVENGVPAAGDRRRTDRRRNQPATWTAGAYLLLTLRASTPAAGSAPTDAAPKDWLSRKKMEREQKDTVESAEEKSSRPE